MNAMNARTKTERARLSAEDWEQGALDMIAEQGIGALAVEALARRLGVTKGSFYWHFRNPRGPAPGGTGTLGTP